MAKSEQEISNLISQLDKLRTVINKVRTDIDKIDDIRMSDSVNQQIRQQVDLLQQLSREYSKLKSQIPFGAGSSFPAVFQPKANSWQATRQVASGNKTYSPGQFIPSNLAGELLRIKKSFDDLAQTTSRLYLPRNASPQNIYGAGPGTTHIPSQSTVYGHDPLPNQLMLPAGQRQLLLPANVRSPYSAPGFTSEYDRRPYTVPDKKPYYSPQMEDYVPRYIPNSQRPALDNPFKNIELQDATKARPENKNFSVEELKVAEQQYSKVLPLIDKYGMSMNNLTNAQKEAVSGLTTLNFQQKNSAGVLETVTVRMDKYGRILGDTQKRFRTFGSSILRNVAEVAKWTIAVQLIYAPMQMLGELMQVMIANEAKLADITVAVGKAQADTSKIFETAASVAKLTGETINGVLEGYELAYRAAGSMSDPIDRATTANILLADSMVLSKLAGLDQSVALDTLVGALNQLGLPLTQGRDLIDKWVKVANNANVSLATLAESFAITAASAENAGLTIDELNGIIATISESTTLSATESGNAVRAFISGFQTDKAQKELGSFGISLRDTSGDIVDFYDVMLEISQLRDMGLISDAELNRIGEAIGGGARRGAQVVAIIENLSRVQEIAKISASAHGDAEEALGIKLETVQTKVRELGNSFQKLAQTLGVEGGLLDIFKIFATGVNIGLDKVNGLAKAMGNSLPIMLAYGLALRSATQPGAVRSGLDAGRLKLAEKFPKAGGVLLNDALPGAVLGGAATLAMAGTNMAQGKEGGAIGNIVGGLAGGFLGALTGNPMLLSIGATIGSSVGGAFLGSVLDHEGDFSALFSGIVTDALESAPDVPKTREEQLSEERKAFADELTGKNSLVQAFGATVTQGISQGYASLYNMFHAKSNEITGMTREQAGLAFSGGASNTENINKANLLRSPVDESGELIEGSSVLVTRNKIAKEYAVILATIAENLQSEAQTEIATGDISIKKYKELKDSIGGLDLQLAGNYQAFGSVLKDVNSDIVTAADAFEYLAEIIYTGSAEDIQYLSDLRTEIFKLMELLAQMDAGKLEEISVGDTTMSRSDIASELATLQQEAASQFKLLDTQQRFGASRTPSIINLDATREDFKKILAESEEWMRTFHQEMVKAGTTELSLDEWRSTFEGFFVDLGDDMGKIYIEGFMQSAITGTQELMEKTGEIISSQNIGMKAFEDVTMEQMQAAAAQSLVINANMEQQYGKYGYEGDTETFIGVAKDGIAGPITAEMTIMQMLLRDLIDVSEKQLEGIYNLPTDASFYVPFTGYAMGQGGGGGGGSTLPFDNMTNTGQGVSAGGGSMIGAPYTPSPLEMFYAKKSQGLLPAQQSISQAIAPATTNKYTPGTNQRGTMAGNADQSMPLPAWLEPPFAAASSVGRSLNGLIDMFKNLLGLGDSPTSSTNSTDLKTAFKDIEGMKPQALQTNFNLAVSSNIQLFLDGQVVANVVKQYLHDEIIRQEGTSTITRGVII